MEVKKGRELQTELEYQKIQKQREEYAGEDCLTVVDGSHVVPIGRNHEYKSCLKFIIEQLTDDPNKFMVKGHFIDAEDMYGYLFESCNDENELKQFLEDYYDGMKMENYGRL
ncbi:hypothetical protein IMAU10149_00708 [Lactobacillus helveticus]|uniref:hypothetical protein n=1 Tax=Lactobacillus helveticus TaxID=1587 RepID=UPI0015648C7B|nr:hypothetical protein [Lactobacillus helveticus]NRO84136.1 hypothetical protein [Lactobacillus helveticus]